MIADSRALKVSIGFASKLFELRFSQSENGEIIGSASGLTPLSQEDHILISKLNSISPLEWMYQRLLTLPFVSVEVIGE